MRSSPQIQLYVAPGDEFTREVEAGMQEWLDANLQDKFGKQEYKLARFGLSAREVAPKVERYLSRYDIERAA